MKEAAAAEWSSFSLQTKKILLISLLRRSLSVILPRQPSSIIPRASPLSIPLSISFIISSVELSSQNPTRICTVTSRSLMTSGVRRYGDYEDAIEIEGVEDYNKVNTNMYVKQVLPSLTLPNLTDFGVQLWT
ncbi:hypothetical protein M9H77_24184 [Catharanthus roseus]|uniref:Uncharacterized protein n=1 Tax=Catharanthus roseus TaxID=4058 RepID=A0ACC0AZJ4_CATRO|nr:hypothetical protein M9H77_24184 [Catharanthus roseus]